MNQPDLNPRKEDLREVPPVDPARVRAFAVFFKRYMSVSTLVVASLPIPVTSLGFIPTFSAQTKSLSVYSTLFCFLTLGFIFYSRHQLARIMFPEYFESRSSVKRMWRTIVSLLPLFFIASSIVLVFQYHDVLNLSVSKIIGQNGYSETIETKRILAETSLSRIWYSSRLMILYIGIFLTAEAAFIMMAIKEYLQDLIGLTELGLINGPAPRVKFIQS